jgi:antitoxin component YwqK of YwqJK toxin-antitoxin module
MRKTAKINTIKKQYNDGMPFMEYTILNNYLHGLRQEWYPSGQLMVYDMFQIGKQDGVSRRWAENGILIFEANYASGCLEGIVTYWYDTGFLKRRMVIYAGKRNGIYEEWYPSGNKQFEYTYKDDKKHGLCKDYYDIPGTVKAIYNMENDILIGDSKEWDTYGKSIPISNTSTNSFP